MDRPLRHLAARLRQKGRSRSRRGARCREGVLFTSKHWREPRREHRGVLDKCGRAALDLPDARRRCRCGRSERRQSHGLLDPREDSVTAEPLLRIFAEREGPTSETGTSSSRDPRAEILEGRGHAARGRAEAPQARRDGVQRHLHPAGASHRTYPIARGRTTRATPSPATPVAPGPLETATEGTPHRPLARHAGRLRPLRRGGRRRGHRGRARLRHPVLARPPLG